MGANLSLYLALGDSITAGYGVGGLYSFPTVYAQFLRRHEPNLKLLNLGINGLTTGGLLVLLQKDPRIRRLISQASLVTITIGSNDLLQFFKNSSRVSNPTQLTLIIYSLRKTMCQIGEEIRSINPTAVLKIAAIYNPLPAGPYAQYSNQAQLIIDQVNRIIIDWAYRYGGNVAFIDREFHGKEQRLIGPDYAHPNVIGHQRIARALLRA
ncbi:lysophospholipase L1-like esterase [Desulfosporosinus acidiphilus SJ4]|uniref:Lysophospholipase L1-like esterase n=1 Tax=Desulfosporosinus acidiphilus (strain DSM 22704 / JCM 16185 / SJ4) TaxID=646529 RepID=I4D5S9_DESAJ|nr:SGNH/GDSL hydrolase family protein [Desulfosporosinus acidiphilus]AFM41153.1 lysophospholipase L1-like esterase [Desulfosporosinus acidiphilus SJ4]